MLTGSNPASFGISKENSFLLCFMPLESSLHHILLRLDLAGNFIDVYLAFPSKQWNFLYLFLIRFALDLPRMMFGMSV